MPIRYQPDAFSRLCAAACENNSPAGELGSGAARRRTEELGLETIIVTATRRSVELQQLPATVEALPAGSLAAFNVEGVYLPNAAFPYVPGHGLIESKAWRRAHLKATGQRRKQIKTLFEAHKSLAVSELRANRP